MKGQSLFEVIFAIAIAALILVGVVSITANSVRNASFARNQALATRYAQEASEWLRSQRDADWTTFVSWSLTPPGKLWCLGDVSSGLTAPAPSCNQVPGTIFTREVTLIEESSDIVRAEISVSWTDAQGVHETRSVARFTNWQGGKIGYCFFDNPQPSGSTSALCQPDPPGGSPSSSCDPFGGGECCRHTCDGGITHWCERILGPPGTCSGFEDCGLEC